MKILTWDGSGLCLFANYLTSILHLLQLGANILIPLSGGLRPLDRRVGSIDCIAWLVGSAPALRKDRPDHCRRASLRGRT